MKSTTFRNRSITAALALGALTIPRLIDASQLPFRSSPSRQEDTAFRGEGSSFMFETGPLPNATHNYVFDTVASLLQRWPNTRYRNGHTIVPVTIPVGTVLSHGTNRPSIPQTPDWVSLDPEHSYTFCVAPERDRGCWHLTLAVKTPLKLLYFDGSSGAKMRGPLDVQDIIAWGKVVPERTRDEESRIRDLCSWGEQYGLDGFLRMSMNFEIMICNFTKGLEVVSFLNLETEITEEFAPLFPRPGEMWVPVLRGLEAGHWHNNYPGDPRIKLDISHLISFYDARLFPVLVEARREQERPDHRVEKLGEDREDRARLLDKLDEVLRADSVPLGSGVDWSALTRVIVHRFASRLEVLRYLLNKTTDAPSAKALNDAHTYVASMLAPYIVNGVRPRSPLSPGLAWASPVFQNCAETHTKFISEHLLPQLTTSERLILESVRGVLHEICRAIVGIWAEGVEIGVDVVRLEDVPEVDWEVRVDRLMKWLDWSVWVKCTPECEFEEICWLPTWPGWPWTNHGNGGMPDPDDDYWRRPQPQCMRRVAPFKKI